MQNTSSAEQPPTTQVRSFSTTPKLLLILDGFGIREEKESNAIAAAHTPNFDALWKDRSRSRVISASGFDVGLPGGQMGNSEVGHMNMGSGRIMYQDLTKISKAIADGDFFHHEVLVQGVQAAIKKNAAVHILGLLSAGGVHSHESHIAALIDLAHQQGAQKIYVHCFLDGRDTPPKSAAPSLQALEEHLASLCSDTLTRSIATICGRFYAMDRDNRWERVEPAYKGITTGQCQYQAESANAALQAAYSRDETDEFVPITRTNASYQGVQPGDAMIFANFRADRAQELSLALFNEDFDGFARPKSSLSLSAAITMTQYSETIDATVAFPSDVPVNTLGEILSQQQRKQLRLAETEKYAHVTFFMNAGIDAPWPLEDRILIPSPKVRTYDEAPAMSLAQVTDALCSAIENKTHDVIICNFANADMVGHTGNFDATVQAIESIDKSLGRVMQSLAKVNGEALITADHGNAEQMQNNATGQAHTAHTSEPVPLIYVGPDDIIWQPVDDARLSDLAPTLLHLMNLEQPSEMTGRCLLRRAD